MTTTKFMKKKNKLIKKHTGITLIPKDQIKEVPALPLSMDSDITACPYCQVFVNSGCDGCPMALAGNECTSVNPDSTYEAIATTAMLIAKDQPWYKDLKKLIKKFNKELSCTP